MKTNDLAISLFLSAISSSCFAFSPSFVVTSKSSLIHRSTLQEDTAAAETIDNTPDWDVKQHLYGIDDGSSSAASVTIGADGTELDSPDQPLPLPDTYITCGKCKALFAIAEEDLGTRGKGCRVKCSVCNNSWYQSRDRLLNIPSDSHVLLPMTESNLDRIQRNLAQDLDPAYMGVSKLYVGNLDFGTSADDLKEFFERNGCEKVCDVSVITGPDGRSRGFAFVTFYDAEDGKKGLECNGKECNGRELAVREPNN
jgi:heterogeneous nuclear ribonucleoprotein A1/A3